MNERADAMDAEMDRMPATWEPGYRDEVRASLGGPAGEMAAPWDQEATRAAADWLVVVAEQAEQSRVWALHSLSPGPLRFALAYLGEADD
jgi:hypothetical protein